MVESIAKIQVKWGKDQEVTFVWAIQTSCDLEGS